MGFVLFGILGTVGIGWLTIPTAAITGYLLGREIDSEEDQVSELLASYDDEIDHWRVETKPNTETVEVVEGNSSLE